MWHFDAVIISDLHLGACNSRTSEITRFLDTIHTGRLIIAGDLFDNPRLRGLRPQDITVLEALRAFSERAQVEWLRGNHDPPAEWYSGLLGLAPLDEVLLNVGDATYLVCHGHAWDRSLHWPRSVVATADLVYHGSQRLDRSHRVARWLKRRTKFFIKAVDRIRQHAVAEAGRRGLQGVILGHSHVVEERRVEGIHYLNCGCWTERPSTFVGVRAGRAHTYEWEAMLERAARFEYGQSPDDDFALVPV